MNPEVMPRNIVDMEYEPYAYPARLQELRRKKERHTELKRARGPRDTDDWGDIPYRGTWKFTPETDDPRGLLIGPRACGWNFRRFLESSPTYVCEYSSLLGGYYFTFMPYASKWDPDRPYSHLQDAHREYNIVHGIDASQHFGIDLAIGLRLGFDGLLRKIRDCREANPAPDLAFYEALENTVIGIRHWIENHAEAALAAARAIRHPEMRRNLERLAEMNRRLAGAPPATFHEAVQWIAWYQMAARMYNGSGALGKLDLWLYPYYRADKAAGRLTDEEAIFHLQCLNISDPQYIHIGGIDEDGRDASNELSFLLLEAVHGLKIPANISIGVHDGMNPALMRRAVELLFLDKLGIPRFFGAETIANGYARNGIPLRIARQRQQVGCHWTCLPGIEYSFSDVIKINFAKTLNVALREMLKDCAPPSVVSLWSRFERHLRHVVDVVAQGIDLHMEHKHRYFPELVLDLLCHGPLEKGVDASHGALEYNTICVDGAALATAADSLAALETRVETEGRLNWEQVLALLDADFRNDPRAHALLANAPSYGRGGTPGDRWAERISEAFTRMVKERPTPHGWTMVPGLFSWASTIPMGRQTEATPNGRRGGEPISFGANPDPGSGKGGALGPTMISAAIARVQPGYGNAAPMQLDADPGLVHDADGVELFEALIRGHFRQGGTLINANVLDKQTILDACADPSKYPDLVVRVTGFSAYFSSLSPEFRKLVYDRIVAMENG